MDIFVDFINWFIDGFAESILWLLDLLPKSPTLSFGNNPTPALANLGYVTWILPYPTMIIHFSLLLTAIGVYYVYRVIGRWLKVVRS
jgi:hypothetical protein